MNDETPVIRDPPTSGEPSPQPAAGREGTPKKKLGKAAAARAAIAATEALYAEMWAQDATAMYGYAGASATASQVTPFTAPPQTTNSSDLVSQSAAAAQSAGTAGGTDLDDHVVWPASHFGNASSPAEPRVAAGAGRRCVHGDRQ